MSAPPRAGTRAGGLKKRRKLTPERKARHLRLGIGAFTDISQGMVEEMAEIAGREARKAARRTR